MRKTALVGFKECHIVPLAHSAPPNLTNTPLPSPYRPEADKVVCAKAIQNAQAPTPHEAFLSDPGRIKTLHVAWVLAHFVSPLHTQPYPPLGGTARAVECL